MNSIDVALLIVMISVNYCICLLAVWSVTLSGYIWVRSTALVIPLMLLAAADAVEPIVYLASQYLAVAVIASSLRVQRDLVKTSLMAEATRHSRNSGGFSLKSIFIATVYIAVLVSICRSTLNESPEILKTVFLTGLLAGVAGGLAVHFGLGRPPKVLRMAISAIAIPLVIILTSTMNGFLDSSVQLVDSERWDIDATDESWQRWSIVILSGWILVAATIRFLCLRNVHATRSKSISAVVGMLAFACSVPALLTVFGLLGTSPKSLTYLSYFGEFEEHQEFYEELHSGEHSVHIRDVDWRFVSETRIHDLQCNFPAATRFVGAGTWPHRAKSAFQTLQLVAICRRNQMPYDPAAMLPLNYSEERDRLLQECEPLGWRAQFYKILLWMSRQRYPSAILDLDQHHRTYAALLKLDFKIRDQHPRPHRLHDWEPTIRKVLAGHSDPYSKEPDSSYGYFLQDGDFILYSVGYDGVDDNGKPMETLTGAGDIALPGREESLKILRENNDR